jgi:hypothetical protein
MNRRTLLKQLAVSSAAAFILPSCLLEEKKVSQALSNLDIKAGDEKLISLLAETLIPETDTPGAKSLKADSFALVMVNDCLEKPEQEKYLSGMRAFDAASKSLTGKSFIDASAEERVDILNQVEAAKDKLPEDVRAFYFRTRWYIIQGYTSSQHFLTNIKKYEHIPGPDFKGCVPVATNKLNS